jgi:5-methylcytosine-specific restriction protein A
MSFVLNPMDTDPARIKRERALARELRQTPWWRAKLASGTCHYCGGKFAPAELTMDHVVPLARGGRSVKNNLVPACKPCNDDKKLETPVERLLKQVQGPPTQD